MYTVVSFCLWAERAPRRRPLGNIRKGALVMTDGSVQFWDRMAERYAARPIKDMAAYEAMGKKIPDALKKAYSAAKAEQEQD